MQNEQYTRTKGATYVVRGDDSRDQFFDPVFRQDNNWKPYYRPWGYPNRGRPWWPYYRSRKWYGVKLVATTLIATPIVILELAALLRFIFQP